MSEKPIIGITIESKFDPSNDRTMGEMALNWNYAQAVADAGGVPIILPPMTDMAAMARIIDGWLVPGGADIDAKEFGEENHPAVELQDPRRLASEKALYAAVDFDMPILGICYGCQMINVLRGGTLIQHLPDVLGGDTSHSGGTSQTYHVERSSKLAEITGEQSIVGRSYHHQAIGTVGAGLAVTSRHEDGTIEAIEDSSRPFLIGVQWHPERTFEDPPTKRLFSAFVQAAGAYKAKKSEKVPTS